MVLAVPERHTRFRLIGWDSFDRADSATSMGTATTGQVWVASGGTWGISSNQAYAVSPTTSQYALLTLPTPAEFVRCVITPSSTVNRFNGGLVIRGRNSSNLFNAEFVGQSGNNQLFINKLIGGALTTIASVAQTYTPGTPFTAEFRCIGQWLLVYINGVFKKSVQVTGSDLGVLLARDATICGLRCVGGVSSDDGGTRWNTLQAGRMDS